VKDFHARHLELFGFADDATRSRSSPGARLPTEVADFADACRVKALPRTTAVLQRSMAFRDTGRIEAPSYNRKICVGRAVLGPAIVESTSPRSLSSRSTPERPRASWSMFGLRRSFETPASRAPQA